MPLPIASGGSSTMPSGGGLMTSAGGVQNDADSTPLPNTGNSPNGATQWMPIFQIGGAGTDARSMISGYNSSASVGPVIGGQAAAALADGLGAITGGAAGASSGASIGDTEAGAAGGSSGPSGGAAGLNGNQPYAPKLNLPGTIDQQVQEGMNH